MTGEEQGQKLYTSRGCRCKIVILTVPALQLRHEVANIPRVHREGDTAVHRDFDSQW